MNNKQKEIIQNQIKKLPEDLRRALVDADLPEKFKTITNKHKLRIDQGGALEMETMLVMLGLEHPDDYTKNLKRNGSITDEKAAAITEEVNRMIFLPIRASLKKLHESVQEEEEVSGRIEHPPLGSEEVSPPAHAANSSTKTAGPQTPNAIKERLLQSSYDTEKTQTEHAPDKVGEKDIFKQKLEKQMRFAKEETHIDSPGETKSDPSRLGSPHGEAGPSKADPYKEPIEEKDTRGIVQEGLPTAPASAQAGPKFDGGQEKKPELGIEKTATTLPQQAVAQTTIPPKKKFSFDSPAQNPLEQTTTAKSKEQPLQKSPVQQINKMSDVAEKKDPNPPAAGGQGKKAKATEDSSPLGDGAPGKLDASEEASREEKITAPKWRSGRDRATTEVKSSIPKSSGSVSPNSFETPGKEIPRESKKPTFQKNMQQLQKPAVQTIDAVSVNNNSEKISHRDPTEQLPHIKPAKQPQPDSPRLDRPETDKVPQRGEATTGQAKEAVKTKETKKQKPYEADPYREPIE